MANDDHWESAADDVVAAVFSDENTAITMDDEPVYVASLCRKVIANALSQAYEQGRKDEADRVKTALSMYRASLAHIPLGHENTERGASTYNWKVSVFEEIRYAVGANEAQQ